MTHAALSLVSQQHADKALQIHPHLQFSCLEQPVTVSVPSPSVSHKAVGVMQVPICFENGRSAVFSMLVVPNLTWPTLFGQNHLRLIDAHIRSRELKVHFPDKGLGFTVACRDSNPIREYPSLAVAKCPSSSANVTCLLTTSVHQRMPIPLHKGFNFVTVCVFLAASLVGSPLFSPSQGLWLDGNNIIPGISTLSGPFSVTRLPSMVNSHHTTPPFSGPSHPKCRPNRAVAFDVLQTSCLLSSSSQVSDSLRDIPWSNELFYCTIVIHSTRESAPLPSNVSLGSVIITIIIMTLFTVG